MSDRTTPSGYKLSGATDTCPRPVIILAEQVAAIHGDVRITKEKSGWHLNFASPAKLNEIGIAELAKKHGSINASRYLLLGEYANMAGTGKFNKDLSGRCMATATPYRVSQLLSMATLKERNIPTDIKGKVTVMDTSACTTVDENGNVIPDHPGEVIPVIKLSPEHPCSIFIRERGFTNQQLWEFCRASFCVKEAPEDSVKRRFYKRLHGGFRATAQGRLVLYCDILGVQRGWQARVLERDVGPARMTWHPYEERWVVTHRRNPATGKMELLHAFDEDSSLSLKQIQKYKTATGASRNTMLLGYDSATVWNAINRRGRVSSCCVAEGPLDAARVYASGGAGVALLGKSMSENQARLLLNQFDRIGIIPDNDAAGAQGLASMLEQLNKSCQDLHILRVPAPFKDAGEMPEVAMQELLKPLTQD